MNPKRTWTKKLEETQKQWNEIKEDDNNLLNETKDAIKKKGKKGDKESKEGSTRYERGT
jgi:hypothetical protein